MNLLVAHILRGLQLLFAVIVLATGAAAVNTLHGGERDSFIVFCAVWTIVAVFYFMLAPRFFPPAAHKYALLAVDAVTMIFWFAGFIALAVVVNDVRAFDHFLHSKKIKFYYQTAAAATAFGAFEWALFVATTVLQALQTFKPNSMSTAPNPNPEIEVTTA